MRPATTELRSTAWDGPDPQAGDLIDDGTTRAVVIGAAQGPGVGQWTLQVLELTDRVILWTPDRVTSPLKPLPGMSHDARPR